MLAAGEMTGDLGDAVQDFLTDTVVNDARPVWDGHTFDPNDPFNAERHFPVNVMEYEGVFFVYALEFDNAGYFTSLQDARSYASLEFEHLAEVQLTKPPTPVDPAKGNALLKKLFGTRPLPIVQEDDSPRRAKPKT